MLACDENGVVLIAGYTVERDGDYLDLILESAGGASADRAARNTDYRMLLRVLLGRLRDLGATVEDAVDRRGTRSRLASPRQIAA